MAYTIQTKLERKGNGIKVEDAIAFFRSLEKNKISSGIHKDEGQDVVLKASHTEFGTGRVMSMYPDGWYGGDIPPFTDKPYGYVKRVPPRPAIRMYLYQDMRDKITNEYQFAMDVEKHSKLKQPNVNAQNVLKHVGSECVVMQRDKMARGGYDQSTNDTGLDPENNGLRTINYKGFNDPWVQTGETISAVNYKVTKK